MAAFSLESFRWRRVSNGYRVIRPPDSAAERIFANEGEEIRYFPFSKADNLYALFARLRSKADLLDFIRMFGPLTWGGFNKSPRKPEEQPIDVDLRPLSRGYGEHWFKIHDQIDQLAYNYDCGGEDVAEDLKLAAFFRQCLENSSNPKRLRPIFEGKEFVGMLYAYSVNKPRARVEMWVIPGDLREALRLQLFQKLSGEAAIRSCSQCGNWFEVGPGTSRRLDARFCTDKHRVLFNSLKRSKAG
jgi:hypothetical protein